MDRFKHTYVRGRAGKIRRNLTDKRKSRNNGWILMEIRIIEGIIRWNLADKRSGAGIIR
jgi:hypothetical protein